MIFEATKKITVEGVLFLPEAGCNFLGRDLQVQLSIGVLPERDKMVAKLLWLKEKDERQNEDVLWAKPGNRGKLNIISIVIKITNQECLVRVQQYLL